MRKGDPMNRPTNRVAASLSLLAITAALLAGACGGNPPPVAKLPPEPPDTATATGATAVNTAKPPAPPEPVREPVPVPPEPIRDPSVSSASRDDLNRNSPLKPVFFELDQSAITATGQAALQDNATLMKQNATWVVTIEGHCDERGSAEYNLALGERRALTVRAYLVSLGIPAERLRTVSYGKEFPFDPGHDEAAMAKNRRAHFVITSR
jgi:peptidoglycan-associated lipoprotein